MTTPRPWVYEEGDSVVHIVGAGPKRIASVSTVYYYQKFSDEDLANAALIVRAVNSFDEGRELLREARFALQTENVQPALIARITAYLEKD